MAYSTVNATAGGHTIKVLVPATYVDLAIIYFHGYGSNAGHITSDADKTAAVNMLTDAGYLIASSDAAGNSWGNTAGQDAYRALGAYLDTNYAPAKYGFWPESMGGCCGYLLAANGFTNLVGIYGASPVCSLANMFNGNSGATYPPSIRTAFGIAANGSDYSSKTSGFDPLLATPPTRIPTRFVASTSDTIVNKAANSDAMSATFASSKAERDVILHTGDHGDASLHKAQDISDFMARCFVARSSPQRRM